MSETGEKSGNNVEHILHNILRYWWHKARIKDSIVEAQRTLLERNNISGDKERVRDCVGEEQQKARKKQNPIWKLRFLIRGEWSIRTT